MPLYRLDKMRRFYGAQAGILSSGLFRTGIADFENMPRLLSDKFLPQGNADEPRGRPGTG
jgi:hypothetical protein